MGAPEPAEVVALLVDVSAALTRAQLRAATTAEAIVYQDLAHQCSSLAARLQVRLGAEP